ncbi:hypothetical protein LEP1GSC058_1648 [Leptospira fainei serovar Hurstbridge str. BUT 6]|uniref:Uncharacterized protein n=1 Tax=Leptospira fainei serovar Hurstbridge str. BUT 6 TaxID=1193011 RepID=S3UX55_9LEPT|nr:hypothetical protein [Leptospira fainei]EPG74966.1 hypothetical protein LEP1GSC058_1648 [Leptospira fainei serovar Hurstbridge str. BUT 6]
MNEKFSKRIRFLFRNPGRRRELFYLLPFYTAFLFFYECSGRKVLGHFDQLTIGSEFRESHAVVSKERIKTEFCDKTFLNSFQVGIHGAKQNVIQEALRQEMKKDPSIVAFLEIHFEHSDGCWKIEYTPERKLK